VKFVLDTNTLIYFFKNKGNVARELLAIQPNKIFVPTIVAYEIHVGVQKTSSTMKRANQLTQFLSNVNVLPFGYFEAVESAKVRAALEKKGQKIGPYDTLIAGVALAHKATLVTRNIKEFDRVPKLNTVNWY